MGPANDATQLFLELGGLLVLVAALIRLANRLGVSPIPLYLLAGLAFGTGGLVPLGTSREFIQLSADIGVVLLLLLLGLEYTADELSEGLRSGWRGGLVDLALNFVPGVALGLALGWDLLPAVLLGGVVFNTSSSVMAKVLTDLGRLGNRETVAVLTLSVMEDLTNAVYLPLIGVLLVDTAMATGMRSIAVALVTVVVVLLLALRYGGALSRVLVSRSDEAVLLTVFGLVLLVAGLAQTLQVSSAIGAFLLGIAMTGPLADRARALLGPMRDLFGAVFFLSFGLGIAPESIPPVAALALGVAALTTVTKVATGWWAARAIGIGPAGRLRAGTAFVPRGEFAIVIAGLGVGLEPQLGPLAATYVLITVLAGSLLPRVSDDLLRLTARAARAPTPG